MKHFIGSENPTGIGTEDSGIIDAILALGLWLEHTSSFVAGPLDDEDFLELIQTLSLLSANTPSPTLRYSAHVLTSSILHAHPTDRLRLTFISDTLENCPYETLKAEAVSWLKDETITAFERKSNNVFSTTIALAAVQPYLFPNTSAMLDANDEELLQELEQAFPFHMAVVNFIYFANGEEYAHVVPEGMMAVVEEIYLGPLRNAQQRAAMISKTSDGQGRNSIELELLGERIATSVAQ